MSAAHTDLVLSEVAAERHRQNEKWGLQLLADNDGTDDGVMLLGRPYAVWEAVLKARCDHLRDEWRAGRGDPRNMTVVLLEEVFEALAQAVAGNPERLREELVQVAASGVKWIEIIDERAVEEIQGEAMARSGKCAKCGEAPRIPHSAYCRPCATEYERGRRSDNREEINKRQRELYASDPERYRSYRLKKYNLSREDYDEILESQGGGCGICGSKERDLHVDHDHTCCSDQLKSCGKCVRGLLCSPCNTGLAKFQDDESVILRAAEYIKCRAEIIDRRLADEAVDEELDRRADADVDRVTAGLYASTGRTRMRRGLTSDEGRDLRPSTKKKTTGRAPLVTELALPELEVSDG